MTNQTLASDTSHVDTLHTRDLSPPRRSHRQSLAYISSGKYTVCIICNEKRYGKRREIPVQKICLKGVKETVHKAEKTLIEYAKIHVSNNTKFKSAGERRLLTLSSKSLFAEDIGYHKKSCYEALRSPKWIKKKVTQSTFSEHYIYCP